MALLDEVSSELEDDVDNLMNDSYTEFVLEENLENELDSDDEPLNLLVPEADYHPFENPNIAKTLKEGNDKTEKEVKGKSKEKGKEKEKGKGKGKDKGKSKEKKQRKRNKNY